MNTGTQKILLWFAFANKFLLIPTHAQIIWIRIKFKGIQIPFIPNNLKRMLKCSKRMPKCLERIPKYFIYTNPTHTGHFLSKILYKPYFTQIHSDSKAFHKIQRYETQIYPNHPQVINTYHLIPKMSHNVKFIHIIFWKNRRLDRRKFFVWWISAQCFVIASSKSTNYTFPYEIYH